MKSIFLALITFASISASAVNLSAGFDDGDLEATFISWCVDNKVVSENSNGQLEVQQDCSEKQLTCSSGEIKRYNRILYFATCK